jgi:predicted enzyme related to lactoylglutathione lyase
MPVRDEAWPQGTPCWVDLMVDDVAAARAFYADLFGWEILDSPPGAGGYLMAMLRGRPAAGIMAKPEGVPMPSSWTTYLAADDADDISRKIADAGGRVMTPPMDVMDVGRMLVAADPTGAVFGVWQAKAHRGAGIFNEPGAYTWNEVQTRDFEAAKTFYAAVFGCQFADMGDIDAMRYSTAQLPGQPDHPVFGVNDLTKMPGVAPAHWLAWFAVADCDERLAFVLGAGGMQMLPPTDSPFGRMAIVGGPQGEVFGLIDRSRTVGQPPA